MPTLLMIDDDQGLTQLLSEYLNGQGFSVRNAENGRLGLRSMFESQPDIILLDVTMPEKDGWKTLERIREVSDQPVIMLTARGDESDILKGFSLGADDYVTKPFSFAQLTARIRAVLARSSQSGNSLRDGKITAGGLEVDLGLKRVWRDGEMLSLTPTEFKLLIALMRRAKEVVSPEDLVKEVWGAQYSNEIGHVRRYIWHLRQKVEIDPENPRYIHNERGFGYLFEAIPPADKSSSS
ncbi:MAG: response regulator transcription factor [Anaerolineales bacterium]|nr:response regulator transcription factor [Anaerolineales bacterium]